MKTSFFDLFVPAAGPSRNRRREREARCKWPLAGVLVLVLTAGCVPTMRAAEVNAPVNAGTESSSEYRLGAGDTISVFAAHVEEINNRTLTVGDDGEIRLPQYGRIPIAGLTVREAETAIQAKLKPYYRSPEVTINVVEYGSRPVSVLGAVNKPGVYQLKGPQRLVEVLSIAGGPRQDAGYRVTITRRASEGTIPVDAANRVGDVFVAEVNLTDILSTKNPTANIVVHANDVISVPQARMVYVIGEVRKAGGFVLGDQEDLSVLQALALAEGLLPTAAAGSARILRPMQDGKRDEIDVNLKKLLAGKMTDVAMQPEDILFIPGSSGKKAAFRVLDTAIQIGTGVVIWRR